MDWGDVATWVAAVAAVASAVIAAVFAVKSGRSAEASKASADRSADAQASIAMTLLRADERIGWRVESGRGQIRRLVNTSAASTAYGVSIDVAPERLIRAVPGEPDVLPPGSGLRFLRVDASATPMPRLVVTWHHRRDCRDTPSTWSWPVD